MKFVTKTDVGKKRTNNEDCFFAKEYNENISLFIVADGLGGYEGGEIASKMLTLKVARYFEEHIEDDFKKCEIVEEILKEALVQSNSQIYALEKSNSKYQGMGTTVIMVAILYGKIYYASVGDSRLYYIDNNMTNISQITEDDTYVNTLLKTNVIEKSEVENHPQKHILTKAIGVFKDISVNVKELKQDKGYLLLCTDGLTNMLNDNEILKLLKQNDFDKIADLYIKKANDNGGVDNTTVIVVEL